MNLTNLVRIADVNMLNLLSLTKRALADAILDKAISIG